MRGAYPISAPYDHGMLEVGDGNRIYWETCGNPEGKPALAVHGGPGSGCGPGWTRFFDPEKYRIVLFDQRGCGRSTPSVADPAVSLATNTTQHLMADMELLREHLGIETWLVLGASWGSILGLAYAENHPERVSEVVLFSVVGPSHREVKWITQDMGRIFPEQWERFRDGVPEAERDGNLVDAYARLLASPDQAVREQAAKDWCAWEDTHVAVHAGHTPDPRFEDPVFRMVFARLVTHYWRNAHFLEDGILLREAGKLAGIPGVLVTGRLDVSGPPDVAWNLAKVWPDAELYLVDDAGHGAGDPGMTERLIEATDRFAKRG